MVEKIVWVCCQNWQNDYKSNIVFNVEEIDKTKIGIGKQTLWDRKKLMKLTKLTNETKWQYRQKWGYRKIVKIDKIDQK